MSPAQPKFDSRESGFTLLEGVVSGGILAIIAVALIPAFFSLIQRSQVTNFKIQCNSIVRAKLQEYVTGSGAALGNVTGLRSTPTGFEYSRMRYQTIANACSTSASDFGFREQVSGNAAMGDTDATESGLALGLKGFQLWVNIQRYNPRKYDHTGPIVSAPTRDCPSVSTTFGNTGLLNGYQFGHIGDAIEITVTGVMRTEPTKAQGGRGGGGAAPDTTAGRNASVGGLRDLNWSQGSSNWAPNPELMCSLRQKVSPPSQLFRYFLGADGRIRRYMPGLNVNRDGKSVAPALEAAFRSIWISGADSKDVDNTGPLGNILGFSVAPDNSSVYVLKPGTLIRYDNCGEADVEVNGQWFAGIPDCRTAGAQIATQTEYSLASQNAQIENIAVDFNYLDSATPFGDDRVFGLRNTGPSGADQQITMFNFINGIFEETNLYSLPPVPRIKGILLSHSYPISTKPTLFVMDNTCYFGPGGVSTNSTYCVSIYGAGDSQMDTIYGDLPLQVDAASN
ncbi:MAG: type II secretion system protein [Bdellovibrionales bacterium]|nr:type II secretion system protein [Bdellovibrionales bacterium]